MMNYYLNLKKVEEMERIELLLYINEIRHKMDNGKAQGREVERYKQAVELYFEKYETEQTRQS